jgi:hypothetical protein
MTTLEHKPTQCEKVLSALRESKGQWINGQYFLRTLFLSQYHARIKELQMKGHRIEASDFTDEFGFKSYRLIEQTNEQSGN